MGRDILLLDIGNTKIKLSTLRKNVLFKLPPFKETEQILKYINVSNPKTIYISSVVPATSELIVSEFGEKMEIHSIGINSKFGFEIKYKSPETIGIDRLCGIEGALFYSNENDRDISGRHIITIDFGTATTINILNEKKVFTGGVIAPGLTTMISSLSRGTAQLPEITEEALITEPGYDTVTSIGSGVMNSQIGLVERVLRNIPGFDMKKGLIFATGGNFKPLKGHLTVMHTYIPDLVLMGVASISLKN